ncbi:hypothetical protein [Stenotrophomonas sp. Iso1]|uniref:hypothetical protein n=1 Tax=Stenotrophomonas sp. Iso1 TaxID=2977283 RepID=UPI0022B79F63|nr:hypothetical protein [Stenotrophomonas sp. Iso1]
MTLLAVLGERLKRTALVWLAVYPSALLVLSLVGERFRHWPLPMRVLASTLIIVPVVANISLPLVQTVVAALGRASRRIDRHDDNQ